MKDTFILSNSLVIAVYGYECLAPLSTKFQLYSDEEHRTNYKHP